MKNTPPIKQNISHPITVSFWQAFGFWLKLGFISFGGPAGQIAIMHHELVEKRRWISEKRFLHALNYCMLLPGPEAQQLATYLGWLMHRNIGGIVAGGLFVLPSLFLIIFLSWIYLRFGNIPEIAALLYGIKPAVTAIVLFAAYRIGSRTLKNRVLFLLAIISFFTIFIWQTPFPIIVLSAAFIGAIGGKWMPKYFSMNDGHGNTKKHYGSALIDDDTPTPAHALFRWRRLIKVIIVGAFLWGSVMTYLYSQYGWEGALTQMAWFFSKAALLTFGGAYAVLPYVYQGAVAHYHWLSAAQMMDGLALGETTPGPLIMVVTFVGFVAGWTQNIFGSEQLFLSSIIASLVVTYFTFLPSFLFILAGGPIVESTHGNLKFTAPLSAITAAVVGVILNLAVFFAQHIFLPDGLNGRCDFVSIAILVSALIALIRYKISVISVIFVCGLLGIAGRLFM